MERHLARARRGDRGAFTEIYRAAYPGIARYLYYKVGNGGIASDLADEVFVVAWESLPSFRDGHFPGFLFRVARNLAVGQIRKESRARTVCIDLAAELPSRSAGPEESAERLLAYEGLYRCLARLSERHREVIVLKYLVGMSNDEVATLLGVSPNAVNARRHRALKSLGRILEGEGLLDE